MSKLSVFVRSEHCPSVPADDVYHLLNHGALRAAWQQYLDEFFQHSYEHAQPWTIEGNLQPVPTDSSELSATVEVGNSKQSPTHSLCHHSCLAAAVGHSSGSVS